MDDPWGSPWTSTPTGGRERTPSPTKSTKSGLEPPPRAFLSATGSPRLPAVTASPWADDNEGFGDWTSADTTTTSTTGAQSSSGWAGGWGSAGTDTPGAAHGQQHLSPTPRDEGGFGFSQASPIAWPGNTALSPGYKNGSGSSFRQPSPDPWASEFDDFKEAPDLQSNPSFVLDRSSTPTPAKGSEPEALHEEAVSAWNEDGLRAVIDEAAHVAADTSEHGGDSAEIRKSTDVAHTAQESGHIDDRRTTTSSKPRSAHSRSSSVSRSDTDSDHDRQDSPITSIDEDGRSRIALPPRKGSGRIQVLVEKFDGLAKAASEEHLPAMRDSTPRKGDGSDAGSPSEEVADFGDFEDADADAALTTPVREARTPSPRTSLERTPTPKVRSPETPARQKLPSVTSVPSPDDRRPVARPVPVHFDLDHSKIDSLFDDLQLQPVRTYDVSESGLPDHIITDSFTDISERKAWYRVSRQGSSRMHHSGDIDSYRRVAWPTTTVHAETLKIVRRWMEQDSITGRTTLGGGASRANMFNWDSAAEPVALDEVFAKRRRAQRPVSLQQPLKTSTIVPPPAPGPLARDAKAAAATAKQRPMSFAGAPAGGFGWSTSPVALGAAEQQPSAVVSKPRKDETQTQVLPAKRAPGPLNPPLPREDDDDDWGEMVSSPPVDAKPMTLPSLGGSRDGLSSASPPHAAPLPVSSKTTPTYPPSQSSADGSHVKMPDLWEQISTPAALPTQPTIITDLSHPSGGFGMTAKPAVATASSPAHTQFTPTTPLEIMSPLPVPTETPTERSMAELDATDQGDDDDDGDVLVRQILDGLPDLSYMLR